MAAYRVLCEVRTALLRALIMVKKNTFEVLHIIVDDLGLIQCMYVAGSLRLAPLDVLQPKAYCTDPGLQSFLLAPPGVSTRDPISERRNLGEIWPVISTESCDFHAYTFGFFYIPQTCDMGQTALILFRRQACWEFFRLEKSDGFSRVWTHELGYQRPALYL